MKRDMEVIRELLLWLEEQESFAVIGNQIPDFGDRPKTIGHLALLESGGFVYQSQKGVYRVSWDGYEFLDKVRDPEIWNKTKDGAAKVGSWSIKFLGDLATGFMRAKAIEFGLPIA